MLSKDVSGMFSEFEARYADAPKHRTLHGLFIDISLAIARMRTHRGLTQRGLAKRMRTSHPTIARWESPGYSGYTLSKLVELTEALGYNIYIRFLPKDRTKDYLLEVPNSEWGDLTPMLQMPVRTDIPWKAGYNATTIKPIKEKVL